MTTPDDLKKAQQYIPDVFSGDFRIYCLEAISRAIFDQRREVLRSEESLLIKRDCLARALHKESFYGSVYDRSDGEIERAWLADSHNRFLCTQKADRILKYFEAYRNEKVRRKYEKMD